MSVCISAENETWTWTLVSISCVHAEQQYKYMQAGDLLGDWAREDWSQPKEAGWVRVPLARSVLPESGFGFGFAFGDCLD